MYTNHRSGLRFKLHYITIQRFIFHAYPFWQKNTSASFIIGKWGVVVLFFLIRCTFPWWLLREVDKVPHNLSLMPFLGQKLTLKSKASYYGNTSLSPLVKHFVNQKKYKWRSVSRWLQAKGDRSGNLRHQQRDSGPSEPWCPFADYGTVGVRFANWRYDQGTDCCQDEFLDWKDLKGIFCFNTLLMYFLDLLLWQIKENNSIHLTDCVLPLVLY